MGDSGTHYNPRQCTSVRLGGVWSTVRPSCPTLKTDAARRPRSQNKHAPAEHWVQLPEAPGLYVPARHSNGAMEPRGHAYPGGQGAVQLTLDKPEVLPKLPEGHALQLLAPVRLKVPGGHADTVEFVLPGGQTNPAVQFPLQDGDVWPAVDPNRPPLQGPLQEEDVRFTLDPNRPTGQEPLQADVVRPGAVPYLPGWHAQQKHGRITRGAKGQGSPPPRARSHSHGHSHGHSHTNERPMGRGR